jgi:HEPN domain-containing protein
MSRDDEIKALFYLHDAVSDKEAMDAAINERVYRSTVYYAQSTTEKAAKACLSLKGIYLKDHKVAAELKKHLIQNSDSLSGQLQALIPGMITLESLNTEPRYSVSYITVYTEKSAVKFRDFAEQMLELSFQFVELKTGISALPRESDQLRQYIKENYSYIRIKEI